MLLMGLCLPWTANAQEQKTLKGIASEKGGDRGTKTVYMRVTSTTLSANKNYLIVSSATAGANAYALSQTSSNLTSSQVHINPGIPATNGVVYIDSEGLEPTAVWTSGNGWTFSHFKGTTQYYVYGNKPRIGNATFSANTNSSNWTYGNNSLYFHFAGTLGIGAADYYITPSGSTFTLGTSEAHVYIFQETSLNTYEITTSVSPEGAGQVTGAGTYIAGNPVVLEATPINSDYAFVNWTVNGNVLGSEPVLNVNASGSYNYVANFVSTVSCLTPTNLTSGNAEAHSVTLNWDSDASNFNVRYRIMPDGEWQTTTASSNSFTLTGLVPETTYEAQVQTNCGNNNQSDWSNLTTFTTGIACFAPTNVTASNVTNNSAVINWTGEAESYNLRYREIEGFRYGFEDAEPWNYTNFSPCTVYDGDGYGTGAIQDVTFENQHYTGSFIAFQNGVEGASNAYAHSGNAFGACFYATTAPNNDYFILPAITIESGYVFKFWAKSYSSSYLESFRAGVYNGNGNLTSVIGSITSVPTAWTLYSYDLSSYVGQTIQLAINCNSNDKFAFFIDDIFVGNPNAAWSEPITGVTSSYTLTGLDDYTDYEVQVQANCGGIDGLSQWSASATFQTLDDCLVPFSQSTTDITPSGATLNWDGLQSSYNVRYRLAYYGHEQTIENFSGYTAADYNATGVLPTGWMGYSSGDDKPHIANNSVLASSGWLDTSHEITGMGGSGSTDNFLLMISNNTSPYTSYTILPHISHIVSVSFNYAFEDASNGTLSVGYCASNTSGSSFVAFNDVTITGTTTSTRITLTANDIATLNQRNRYLAFRWECQNGGLIVHNTIYCVGIDNITIDYVPDTGSAWTTENNVSSPLTINGLTYSGEYEWQVQGANCDGNGGTTNWSASTIFTTLAAYIKHIDPYTSDGGYYLIASPVGQINPSEVGGMLDNDYDLYYFDQTQDLEWVNYKPYTDNVDPSFDLVPGKGYLYANSGNNGEGIDLVFAQAAYTGSGEVNLTFETGAEFEGMNLVGNPFAVEAYIDRDFYRLADGGAEIMTDASTGKIEPMEGVFVYAESANEPMTFTTSASGSKASRLVLNLSDGNNLIDRAMVRFGEGNMLPKFQLNESSTKVYMTVEGKDYAVVYSDEMGQMPVGFKAKNNGTYTFDFSSEEVSLSYLHLIDNKNGNDVDLLVTPSYTFEAKTTDYENRFKLVFATGNNENDDNFAFFSNGSFVINNEGEATLQVIDINGRILKSESINGCANVNVNAAQGVYMLRLVNGNDVKVQKVVVR